MNLSHRQRVLIMLALLLLFMAGLAVTNAVNQVLGIAICAVAFALAALVAFTVNRRR